MAHETDPLADEWRSVIDAYTLFRYLDDADDALRDAVVALTAEAEAAYRAANLNRRACDRYRELYDTFEVEESIADVPPYLLRVSRKAFGDALRAEQHLHSVKFVSRTPVIAAFLDRCREDFLDAYPAPAPLTVMVGDTFDFSVPLHAFYARAEWCRIYADELLDESEYIDGLACLIEEGRTGTRRGTSGGRPPDVAMAWLIGWLDARNISSADAARHLAAADVPMPAAARDSLEPDAEVRWAEILRSRRRNGRRDGAMRWVDGDAGASYERIADWVQRTKQRRP